MGRPGPTAEEDLHRCSPLHAATRVGPPLVVGDEAGVEGGGLHLLDGLEPGALTLDAEVLVEQRAVEALDNVVWTLLPRSYQKRPAER